jgi:hypothetical protein
LGRKNREEDEFLVEFREVFTNSMIPPCLFYFLALFGKILSNMLLAERIQKINPDLGATVIGAKI